MGGGVKDESETVCTVLLLLFRVCACFSLNCWTEVEVVGVHRLLRERRDATAAKKRGSN